LGALRLLTPNAAKYHQLRPAIFWHTTCSTFASLGSGIDEKTRHSHKAFDPS